MENKRVRRGSWFLGTDQHCTRYMVGIRGRRRSHDQFSLRARSNNQATLTGMKLSLIGPSGRRVSR